MQRGRHENSGRAQCGHVLAAEALQKDTRLHNHHLVSRKLQISTAL